MAFIHSPAGTIQQLKVLLKEQYTDLASILVEAVQNADDARATIVRLAIVEGLQGAAHPLLANPALLVLNDGPFHAQDRRGICSLNFGTKGGSTEQIGRFGLGLKSVFHLGDCFLFSAERGSPGMAADAHWPTGPYLLNPWWDERQQEGFYSEWSNSYQTEVDGRRLQERLAAEASKAGFTKHWFALWVPLRCAAHIRHGNRLSDRDWGDEPAVATTELAGPAGRHRLLATMPLLRHIQEVHFSGMGMGSPQNTSWSIILGRDAQRRREIAWHGSEPLTGSLRLALGDIIEERSMVGREQRLAKHDPRVTVLVDDDRWPQVPAKENETLITKKDRHDPHGAILCVTTPPAADGPALRISWAANTPLADLDEERRPSERSPTSPGLHLILHGEFFVDSGRRHIDRSESKILGRWNDLISTQVTAPLLLPVLHQWLEATFRRIPQEGAWVLGALEGSKTWAQDREASCASHHLALCLTKSGVEWQLWTPDDRPLLQLPKDVDTRLLERDLPGVSTLVERARLAMGGTPTLTTGEPVAWDGTSAALLLANPGKRLGEELASLRMFITVLRRLQEQQALGHEARLALVRCMERLLENQPENINDERKSALAELIAALPLGSRWILATRSMGLRDARKLAMRLSHVVPGLLVIPADLAAGQDMNPTLAVADAVALIQGMMSADPSQAEATAEIRATLVREVVVPGGNPRREVLEHISDIPWIHARVGQQSGDWLPWATVAASAQADLLIAYHNTAVDLYKALCEALAHEHPVAVDRSEDQQAVAALLDRELPRCESGAVAALVVKVHLHANPARRAALVPKLHPSAHREAIRYLLHGAWDHRGDSSVRLLALHTRHGQGIISRLLRSTLRESGEEWTVLDPCMALHLTDAAKAELGVTNAEDEAITGLHARNPDALRRQIEQCNPEEREELQEGLRDKATALALPIWKTTDRAWTAATGSVVYRDPDGLLRSLDLSSRAAGLVVLEQPAKPRGQDHLLQVPALTKAIILESLLKLDAPHQRFEAIARLWAEIPDIQRNGLKGLVHDQPWIRMGDGSAAALRDFIPMKSLKECVADARNRNAPFWTKAMLSDGDAEALQRADLLSETKPAKRKALEVLVGFLRKIPDMGFGPHLRGWLQLEDIGTVAEALDRDAPVGWRIFRDILQEDAFEDQYLIDSVLPLLPSRLTTNDYHNATESMRRAYESASGSTRSAMHKVLGWYLSDLDERERQTVLAGTCLPNRQKTWCAAETLCARVAGIERVHQVHEDLEPIWAKVTSSAHESTPATMVSTTKQQIPYEDALRASVATAEAYFSSWRDIVPDSAIGGLLCAIGDHPFVYEAAQRWLGSSWPHPQELRSKLIGDNVKEAFLIESIEMRQETMEALSVTGQKIMVRISHQSDKPVLLPDRQRNSSKIRTLQDGDDGEHMVITAVLHPCSIDDLDRASLQESLRDTLEGLLGMVWGNPKVDRPTWNQLCSPHQQNLFILSKVMAGKAMIQLEQLRLPKSSRVLKVLEEWRIFSRQKYAAATPDKDREDELIDDLYTALVEDPTAEMEALQAMRGHIGPRHFQYHDDSVPFELLQNADDAIQEEQWLREQAGDTKPILRRITLVQNQGGLAVIHGGRQINRARRGNVDATDRGFDRDLEKMLSISVSDKNRDDALQVTGRFGLGFKSCYLIADRPEILSGDYCCRIHAGIIPLEISDQGDGDRLRDLAKEYGDGLTNATVIRLPWRSHTHPGEVMQRLIDLAPWQALTLRSAHELAYVHDRKAQRYGWTKRHQSSDQAWAVVDLADHQQALILGNPRDPQRVMLVLGLDHQGPVALPDQVPGLWLTTPLRQAEQHGFFVNAPFTVDVGRGQIAIEPETNASVVERLQQILHDGLTALWETTSHDDAWMAFLESTGMSIQLLEDRQGFWSKLLTILARPFLGGSADDSILRRILWGTDDEPGAVRQFLVKGRRIPSGLKPPAVDFVGIEDGVMIIDADYGELLPPSAVPAWTQRSVAKGSCGSGCISLMGIRSVPASLAVLAGIPGPNGLVQPHIVDGIADMITRMKPGDERVYGVHAALRQTLILTDCGTTPRIDSIGLLFPAVDPHGEKWHVIANKEKVISDRYGQKSQQLLRQAGAQRPSNNVYLGWILQAEKENQAAALTCLEVSDYDLKAEVFRHAHGTWLEECLESPEAASVAPSAMAGLQASIRPQQGVYDTKSSLPPQDAIASIANWWKDERVNQVAAWNRQHYPQGGPPTSWDIDDPQTRLAWMRLYALAFAQRMGRVSANQNRTFLAIMEQRGWLQRLGDEQRFEDPLRLVCQDLMERYDATIQDADYTNWWPLILPLAIVGRRLPDYVDAMREMGKEGDVGNVDTWFSPRIQPQLQGAVDAPPIGNLLGIGRHFIVRELVRSRLIHHAGIHPHCWVPSRRIRNIVSWLSGKTLDGDHADASESIHRIMDHSGLADVFGTDFDLPLDILATNDDLAQRVLGISIPNLDD